MIDVFLYKRDDYFARGTVWGLAIIDKKRFVELFQEEKGEWPEGKRFDDVKKKFGPYIPNSNGIIDNIDAFNNDKNLFGGVLLGDIYSHSLERRLGFEIFSATEKESESSSKIQKALFYPVSMIGQLLELRSYIIGETPRTLIVEGSDPAYMLNVINKYVTGAYTYGNLPVMKPEVQTIELLKKIGVIENKSGVK